VIFLALLSIAVMAAVLVAASMSLFLRRHGQAEQPKPSWLPTDEVFKDPRTERTMRVWADRIGGRHYLPDVPSGPVASE
jgi:hypothetical protein